TGHFLRLLEMPELALDWSHTLLRLLLKYREVIGLGDLAERVLTLARTLKGLRSLLSDASSVWMGVVALPESLSVPETGRLLPRLRGLGLRPEVLLVNRVLDSGGEVPARANRALSRLLAIDPGLRMAAAPLLERGPTGVADLARFAGTWREIEKPPGDSP
ncbi:MAG TPA: ArsA-related P-loop ATPase, partial [Longimicrobiaceae bacterium]|nr:ArsA-related P-loop ATPase [Longimicrobiaceae bacterium]